MRDWLKRSAAKLGDLARRVDNTLREFFTQNESDKTVVGLIGDALSASAAWTWTKVKRLNPWVSKAQALPSSPTDHQPRFSKTHDSKINISRFKTRSQRFVHALGHLGKAWLTQLMMTSVNIGATFFIFFNIEAAEMMADKPVTPLVTRDTANDYLIFHFTLGGINLALALLQTYYCMLPVAAQPHALAHSEEAPQTSHPDESVEYEFWETKEPPASDIWRELLEATIGASYWPQYTRVFRGAHLNVLIGITGAAAGMKLLTNGSFAATGHRPSEKTPFNLVHNFATLIASPLIMMNLTSNFNSNFLAFYNLPVNSNIAYPGMAIAGIDFSLLFLTHILGTKWSRRPAIYFNAIMNSFFQYISTILSMVYIDFYKIQYNPDGELNPDATTTAIFSIIAGSFAITNFFAEKRRYEEALEAQDQEAWVKEHYASKSQKKRCCGFGRAPHSMWSRDESKPSIWIEEVPTENHDKITSLDEVILAAKTAPRR